MTSPALPPGTSLHGTLEPGDAAILTPEALAFVAELVRTFRPRVTEALERRVRRQAALDAGATFDFLAETRAVREGDWRCDPAPAVLADRRVEITGPVDRKMIINALNAGANVFMADFEDSSTPTLRNQLDGQRNLFDAVRRTITFEQNGKAYALAEKTAVLFVRPRGWHLPEAHFVVDGAPAPGALFDFGLFFFHNAKEQLARGAGPFFYLPKMESHLEARIWRDVFVLAEDRLGLPRGSIRATVLVETLPAAFEMHEILHELREHSAGLNCGRWDYIFSFIKKQAENPAALLPDRSVVTMDKGFLSAYARLLVATCHRRGVHAMGGMAAQIPIKNDDAANEAALAKVRADKEREAKNGHDGTWVAHPGLVPIAREVFDRALGDAPNQIARGGGDAGVRAQDLLAVPAGDRTEDGLRHNVRVGVRYLEAWLRGLGCVPIYNLMEDAATAEISRAQIWQWLRHGAQVGGAPLDRARLERVVAEEMTRLASEVGDEAFRGGRFDRARALFLELATAPRFADFLTLPAYDALVAEGA